MFRNAVLPFVVVLLGGCATTREVTLNADVETTVTAAPWNDLSDGELLGKTPLRVDVGSLRGRVLVLSAPGKLPQYWVISDQLTSEVSANVKMTDAVTVANQSISGSVLQAPVEKEVDPNSYVRLLLKAYQNLLIGNVAEARALAAKAAELSPKLAAPDILIGLSYLQEGEREQARAALQKARALDPQDTDIEKLLLRVR